MSTQFDKELDRLFKDWGLENWSVKSEAKEAIKKAVEVHIIGQAEYVSNPTGSSAISNKPIHRNELRAAQLKHLYGEDK